MEDKMKELNALISKLKGEVADQEKTPEILEKIYEEMVKPLHNLIRTKIIPLEVHFNKTISDFWYNNGSFDSFPEKLNCADKQVWMIGFAIRLEGFKQYDKVPYNVYHRFEINLEKYNYIFGLLPSDIWGNRRYAGLLPGKQDLDEWANRFHDVLVDDTKKHVEQLLKIQES